MRLSSLLPMLLAFGNMDSLAKPGQAQQPPAIPQQGMPIETGLQGVDGVGGGKIPGLEGNLGIDPSTLFGSGSVDGMSGLEGQQAPECAASSEDPSFDPNAQMSTSGDELEEMLSFMRRCVEMLEQMQASQQNGEGGGGMPGLPSFGSGGGGGGGGATAPEGKVGAPSGPPPMPPMPPELQQPPQGALAQQPPAGPAPQTTTGAAPAEQQQPVGATTEAAKPTGAKGDNKQYTLDGGGSYTHHLVNNTDKPMDIAYFKNNGPGMQPGFSGESLKVRLEPGETADVSIPDDWQGRAQKYGGKMDDPATWAEFNNEPADASKGRSEAKTWFDVSKIPGGNANLTMKTGDGVTAGSDHSMLEAAKKDPRAANLLTKDAAGNDVFKPAQGFDGKTNKDVVDFFTQYEPEKAQSAEGNAKGKYDSYILPNNDSATRVSQSKEMTMTFGDL